MRRVLLVVEVLVSFDAAATINACGSGSLLCASLFAMLLPNRMIELSSTDRCLRASP